MFLAHLLHRGPLPSRPRRLPLLFVSCSSSLAVAAAIEDHEDVAAASVKRTRRASRTSETLATSTASPTPRPSPSSTSPLGARLSESRRSRIERRSAPSASSSGRSLDPSALMGRSTRRPRFTSASPTSLSTSGGAVRRTPTSSSATLSAPAATTLASRPTSEASAVVTLKRRSDHGPAPLMKEIFGGALLSQVKYLPCKAALARFFQPQVQQVSEPFFSFRKKLSVARKQMFIHEHPMCLSYSSRDLKVRMVQKLTGESNLMEFLGYQSSCVI
ncbi:unnamed protein product [Musa acuminata subsp. malaccensis]|uniref:(wild Malaysian banana) hypothetical protein n=1 Tax=Musa acuminata subsp. malaccensis TaxID=214687 RepID=A0A804JN19_MUSAM|nr:unnamed protein product [Musa acuminata subsp. malaccensis]